MEVVLILYNISLHFGDSIYSTTIKSVYFILLLIYPAHSEEIKIQNKPIYLFSCACEI